ncbi:MAG: copper-binding protein [Nitrosomonadales bacterium]|nr:copper-binding protein [Nitrosomonadales bacterium]
MKTLTLAFLFALPATGTPVQAASHEHENHHDMAAQQAVATHAGTGVLKAVNAKDGKVQIAHEPIAELNWPPMTMWFALRDPLPYDLKAGDAVRFELMQDEKKQWMIVKIGRK